MRWLGPWQSGVEPPRSQKSRRFAKSGAIRGERFCLRKTTTMRAEKPQSIAGACSINKIRASDTLRYKKRGRGLSCVRVNKQRPYEVKYRSVLIRVFTSRGGLAKLGGTLCKLRSLRRTCCSRWS